jgi:thiol-disulfide isomerase/thioredoxin
MKKLFIAILLVPFIFACNPAAKKGAELTGKASNLASGFFILGGPGGAKDTVKTDASGAFTVSLAKVVKPSNYYILVGKSDFMRFKVAPGMKLDLSFDASAFKTSLKFSGKGSDINNYLLEKTTKLGDMDYEMYKLDPAPFRAKQDSILAVSKSLLAGVNRADATDPFWKDEEAEVLFTWANNLGMYESYHGYFAGVKDFKVPADFNSFKAGLDINNPAYVGSEAFKQYISSAVYEAVGKKTDALKAADSTAVVSRAKLKIEVAREMITNEEVLYGFLSNDISGAVQFSEIDADLQSSIDYFRANCKDTALLNPFNTMIESWKKLDKGQPAFEIVGKDMQGNTVKLSDFKGKLVYVDVWATWCGPCKYEIPYLDTLETDYHGKDIVFISYSIDEDYNAWLNFVPESGKKLQGVQIIGEKAWESQLCKDYKISGVPTFMLFDKEGKIVSVKMTRPSSKETRTRIDALL